MTEEQFIKILKRMLIIAASISIIGGLLIYFAKSINPIAGVFAIITMIILSAIFYPIKKALKNKVKEKINKDKDDFD